MPKHTDNAARHKVLARPQQLQIIASYKFSLTKVIVQICGKRWNDLSAQSSDFNTIQNL